MLRRERLRERFERFVLLRPLGKERVKMQLFFVLFELTPHFCERIGNALARTALFFGDLRKGEVEIARLFSVSKGP